MSNIVFFVFCSVILEPISLTTSEQIDNYLRNVIYQPMIDALYEMTKVKPDEPVEWLANFMLRHNNNKPLIHDTNPLTVRHLKVLRGQEERLMNLKPAMEKYPANCGCYLSNSSSDASK